MWRGFEGVALSVCVWGGGLFVGRGGAGLCVCRGVCVCVRACVYLRACVYVCLSVCVRARVQKKS